MVKLYTMRKSKFHDARRKGSQPPAERNSETPRRRPRERSVLTVALTWARGFAVCIVGTFVWKAEPWAGERLRAGA